MYILYRRKIKKELGKVAEHFKRQMGDQTSPLTSRLTIDKNLHPADLWLEKFEVIAGKRMLKQLKHEGFSVEQTVFTIIHVLHRYFEQQLYKIENPRDGQWSLVVGLAVILQHYRHAALLHNVVLQDEKIDEFLLRQASARDTVHEPVDITA